MIHSCQGNGGGVCTDIKPSNCHLIYQSHDKSSQAMLDNDSTVPTEVVFTNLEKNNIPVECDTSDLDTALQTQYATVGDCNREEVIPLYIWADRNSSKDYTACIQQNGNQLRYIPLTDLKLYHGPEVIWEETPSILQAHKLIRHSGVPIF